MTSRGTRHVSAKAALVCIVVAALTLNVGGVVAKEPLSPQVISAILWILGSPSELDIDGVIDTDGDGVSDSDDAFPTDPEEFVDTDGDGVGDNADAFPDDPAAFLDHDRDGAPDEWNEFATQEQIDNSLLHLDAFPEDPAASVDTDLDGMPDDWNEGASEADIANSELIIDENDDNDAVSDTFDAFPLDPEESLDSDNDGIGNNADLDDDNDSFNDNVDAFPLDPAASIDTDNDGMPDEWNIGATNTHLSDTELVLDSDDDNDGVDDLNDAFPLYSAAALDYDGDGMPDSWNEGATDQQISDSSLILD